MVIKSKRGKLYTKIVSTVKQRSSIRWRVKENYSATRRSWITVNMSSFIKVIEEPMEVEEVKMANTDYAIKKFIGKFIGNLRVNKVRE